MKKMLRSLTILSLMLSIEALSQGLTGSTRSVGHTAAPWLRGTSGTTTKWYVKTDGNDRAAGHDSSNMFRTIKKALSVVAAGDSIFIKGGTYNETITIPASGSSGAGSIVLTNFKGQNVVVRGASTSSTISSDLLVSEGRSHIVVQGIHFWWKGTNNDWSNGSEGGNYVLEVSGGSHFTFRYCTATNGDTTKTATQLWNSGDNTRGLALAGDYGTVEYCNFRGFAENIVIAGASPRHALIRENWLHEMIWNGIVVAGEANPAFIMQCNLIVNNLIERSAAEDGIQFQPGVYWASPDNWGTIISNNVIRNCNENAVDFKGARFVLVENNIVYGIGGDDNGSHIFDRFNKVAGDSMVGDEDGGYSIDLGADSSNQIIVRNNIVYDGHGGMHIQVNWQVYNNSFISNNRNYKGPELSTSAVGMQTWNRVKPPGDTAHYGTRRIFVNNLVMNQRSFEVQMGTKYSTDWVIDYNAYYKAGASPTFSYMPGTSAFAYTTVTGLTKWKSVMINDPVFAHHLGKEVHSISQNPDLTSIVDHPSGDHTLYDFTPTVTSPLKNAGGEITYVKRGVTSNVITVDNSWGLCDGWNAPTRAGDSLCIMRNGVQQLVRVRSINYATHALTLDRSITVVANDKVYFWPFVGVKPDIGALIRRRPRHG